MFSLASFMSQLVGFAKLAQKVVIDLLGTACIRAVTRTVEAYEANAVVADGTSTITIPVDTAALTNARIRGVDIGAYQSPFGD